MALNVQTFDIFVQIMFHSQSQLYSMKQIRGLSGGFLQVFRGLPGDLVKKLIKKQLGSPQEDSRKTPTIMLHIAFKNMDHLKQKLGMYSDQSIQNKSEAVYPKKHPRKPPKSPQKAREGNLFMKKTLTAIKLFLVPSTYF